MFPCACSLRSTQCAALIALATAAGIARIEPAAVENTAVTPTANEAPSQAPRPPPASGYFARVLDLNAHWLGLIQVAVEQADGAELQVALKPRLPVATSLPVRVQSSALGLSPRQHSFPFAVGPPRTACNSLRRVDDTTSAGDSAARRKLDRQVAARFLAARFAPSARAPNRDHRLAGPFAPPSSALRGEPEFSPPCLIASRSPGLRHAPRVEPATKLFPSSP
jgi:hypothetical protein